MKNIALVVAALLFTQALFAQDAGETESSQSLLLQISTLPEAKLTFTQQFKIPFLQGNNSLTEGNNINLELRGELTPISLNGLFEAVLTPIAFFEFALGGRIGSGWNINLFGGDIYGIGLNTKDEPNKADKDAKAFDGALWEAHAGGAIQFDLAAIIPGDWNHVVFRSYHEINHKTYSRAGKTESWYYEDDFGENCNGLNYYGNLLLGYRMPIFLDTVALLAEGDLYLYNKNWGDARTKWGDDRIRWTFAFVLSFTITEKFGAALITQVRTMRNFTQSNWEQLHYRERVLDTSDPLRLEFYRVVLALTYKF